MHGARRIGVFDSGLGGLTVLKAMRAALPNEHFIYLGDTARTPYGSKGKETVIKYSRECARFLLAREIKLLVVACNTASALALDALRFESFCPVVNVIDPAVKLATSLTKNGRIGVIGTQATIRSGAFESAIKAVNSDFKVHAVACPLFVSLVEQGLYSGPIVEKTIEHYLAALVPLQIDTLILGCTHYPLLREEISRYFGDKLQIVECSTALAEEARILLEKNGKHDSAALDDQYYVTDNISPFDALAQQFLGDSNLVVTKVSLQEEWV